LLFDTEIMTGYVDNPMPISAMTIGSLQDLGYSVDYSKADPYILQPAGIVIDPILSGIFLNANQTSSSNDILIGTTANDSLAGMAGNDSLYGLTGDDILRGGLGNDLLDAGTGDDLLTDIKGNNTLLGGTGNDILRAGAGNDLLDSGTDNDLLISDSGNDTLNGGTGNDTLNSGSGNDLLDGGTGDDYLLGGLNRDVLLGNTGDDLLIGGLGKDSLTGGTGADTFIYRATLESAINANRDVITDFISSDGDKIDTSAIDANTSSDGFQNFSYINNLSFTQPAQIQFNPVSHIIAFNTDNDIAPEMTILLLGVTTFNASDFLYGPK
jgi:Ca2+-binding RTX toxin-like protein